MRTVSIAHAMNLNLVQIWCVCNVSKRPNLARKEKRCIFAALFDKPKGFLSPYG